MQVPGVVDCIVGYSGGVAPAPVSYEQIKDYTESVLVEFDSKRVSFEQILVKWKQLLDEETTILPPVQRQYRIAVFYLNDRQEQIAKKFCADMMEHVDVEPATKFFRAEERHQHFLDRLG